MKAQRCALIPKSGIPKKIVAQIIALVLLATASASTRADREGPDTTTQ